MNKYIKLLLLIPFVLATIACESLFFHPQKTLVYHPNICGSAPENYFIETYDNLTLHSWLFRTKSEAPKGTIIFMHGNSRNISTETISLLWVLNYGYNLYVFDYRGFGMSQGETSFKSILTDAEDALDAFFEIPNLSHDNIILYGQSMGGAAAISSAANSKVADKIKLLIVECSFSSWNSAAKDVASNSFITWPFQYPFYWSFSRKGINSIDYMPNSKIDKTLIIHSYQDIVINYKQGQELYNLAKEPKTLWLGDFGEHARFSYNEKERLRLINFIDNATK